jgi:hypothetical protein
MTKTDLQTGTMEETVVLNVCLSCDYYGVSTEKFCPLCGSQLVHCCEACGERLANPFARFCVQCGRALHIPSVPAGGDNPLRRRK